MLRQPSQQNSSTAGRSADASSYHTQDLLGQQMPWVQRQLRRLSKNGDAAACQSPRSLHGARAPSSQLHSPFAQPGRKGGCSQQGWAAEAAPRAPGGLPDTQGPASKTERDVSSANNRNAACPQCSAHRGELTLNPPTSLLSSSLGLEQQPVAGTGSCKIPATFKQLCQLTPRPFFFNRYEKSLQLLNAPQGCPGTFCQA